ncbi:putative fad binding domain protein [Botrytis fragariae]|uniref:Putative fad binding domain protein n=1 Tax=Botrytis fragariae TaxID=1964551 RepID=A0A8H6AT70_9HELO|nr:putative fad binding domain protein [Botrytis fragariae]KAF5873341.1 putative fad binding domain protein [Botrytis fragariae]
MNIGVICASILPILTHNEGRSLTNTTLCRCLPAHECWPTSATWKIFNQTLSGKLIATKPLASSCHLDEFEEYSERDCESIQAAWSYAKTHLRSSSSIMAPFFSNYSCDPFSPKSSNCIVGTYVQYANTEIVDYRSSYYNGKAIKVGAGVSVMEAMTAANSQGLVVVGGNDGTVGFAGGYTQGGGHGQLVSKYGLAADQVLEWEVVTGNGDFLIASPTENKDLYWALSGGGGGSYGVVLYIRRGPIQLESVPK